MTDKPVPAPPVKDTVLLPCGCRVLWGCCCPVHKAVTTAKCAHRNTIGHEWSSTCQDCGETWQHREPEYVTVTVAEAGVGTERQEFERVCGERGWLHSLHGLIRTDDGEYLDNYIHKRWETWQAARASRK